MLVIKEFADSKKEIERELKSKSYNVIEHLLKLYLMPNNINRNHWKQEIATFLNFVNKFSHNNKYPTEKQLLNWTYYKWQAEINDTYFMKSWITDLEEDYADLDKNANYDLNKIIKEFDSICDIYFNWLCKELNRLGRINRNEIYKKLDEIIPI